MTRILSTHPTGRSYIAHWDRSSTQSANDSKRKTVLCSSPPFELSLTHPLFLHLGAEHMEDDVPNTAVQPSPHDFVSRQTNNRSFPFPPSLSSFASPRTSRSIPYPQDCGRCTEHIPTPLPPTPPSLPLFFSSPQPCSSLCVERNCGSSAVARHAVSARCMDSLQTTRHPDLSFKYMLNADLQSLPNDHFRLGRIG